MSERSPDETRPIRLELGYTDATPGSVLISMGETRVLCTASVETETPRWMKDSGRGWVTAEYGMLPGSSPERVRRDHISGGRAKEISRLIGRSLRAAVNLGNMPETMVRVDCDVIQADGGTRTAAVTGGWIALHQALQSAVDSGHLAALPIVDEVAAISVGIVEGTPRLDLDYQLDVNADVDMNVVMSGRGLLIEVQGTAEQAPFTRDELDVLLDLATKGINELHQLQREAVAE
ncbi:MAG: ribonuclease PH [Acidimicrobiia bacterium]|nr:ribonuclease PH [Acidimicrobiia bacterium]MDH3462067.1 ribonuclease PH [Acidimicrobiia bacterium]